MPEPLTFEQFKAQQAAVPAPDSTAPTPVQYNRMRQMGMSDEAIGKFQKGLQDPNVNPPSLLSRLASGLTAPATAFEGLRQRIVSNQTGTPPPDTEIPVPSTVGQGIRDVAGEGLKQVAFGATGGGSAAALIGTGAAAGAIYGTGRAMESAATPLQAAMDIGGGTAVGAAGAAILPAIANRAFSKDFWNKASDLVFPSTAANKAQTLLDSVHENLANATVHDVNHLQDHIQSSWEEMQKAYKFVAQKAEARLQSDGNPITGQEVYEKVYKPTIESLEDSPNPVPQELLERATRVQKREFVPANDLPGENTFLRDQLTAKQESGAQVIPNADRWVSEASANYGDFLQSRVPEMAAFNKPYAIVHGAMENLKAAGKPFDMYDIGKLEKIITDVSSGKPVSLSQIRDYKAMEIGPSSLTEVANKSPKAMQELGDALERQLKSATSQTEILQNIESTDPAQQAMALQDKLDYLERVRTARNRYAAFAAASGLGTAAIAKTAGPLSRYLGTVGH